MSEDGGGRVVQEIDCRRAYQPLIITSALRSSGTVPIFCFDAKCPEQEGRVFVPWHKVESCGNRGLIRTVLGVPVPDIGLSCDARPVVERLRKYDSILDASEQSKSEAREQLALELALSTDVFSARPFAKPKVGLPEDDRVGTTSCAAEATTLSETGPPTSSAVRPPERYCIPTTLRAAPLGRMEYSADPFTSHTTTSNQSPEAPSRSRHLAEKLRMSIWWAATVPAGKEMTTVGKKYVGGKVGGFEFDVPVDGADGCGYSVIPMDGPYLYPLAYMWIQCDPHG
ncbi:hypothetical protein EDB86DRAFT_2835112 [Lactarius hatsudake]|nr:hypothetical protein EDB86DRAFT_2835112 [Lactarius hatsudake]